MYYIMRKSYYVMHKLLRYAKKRITLCGNYYVMRKLLRYAASHTCKKDNIECSPACGNCRDLAARTHCRCHVAMMKMMILRT